MTTPDLPHASGTQSFDQAVAAVQYTLCHVVLQREPPEANLSSRTRPPDIRITEG